MPQRASLGLPQKAKTRTQGDPKDPKPPSLPRVRSSSIAPVPIGQSGTMPEHRSVSLAQQLQAAAALVHAVRTGQSATAGLERCPAPLRPGVQALGFHALRHLGLAQTLRAQLAPRAPAPAVDALLCVALALLARPEPMRYDAHTLVNQAVQAVKCEPRWARYAGFVNACMRAFLRSADALCDAALQRPVARYNLPDWWLQQLRHDWPEHWATLARGAHRPAPMDLRVNPRQIERDAYVQILRAQGMEVTPIGAHGVRLTRPCPVEALPGFAQGWVSVQDAAAQRAAPLLLGSAWPDGARVLDACAAPGGKTTHLLECAALDVLALDRDPQRCAKIEQSLQRLRLHARVCCADAGDPDTWWDGRPFDAILLDAPCSASGIVRRHPDIAWLRRASDLPQLAAQQDRLLNALWPLLRPGGRLLFATCSVFRAEGEDRIAAFVSNNADAQRLSAPGHLLPLDVTDPGRPSENPEHDHDGFFYALLHKAP
ncbi:MAG: 16S rRNA (cytosine(967)-C(5))-methyltransferase RsmB [Rhodoferax sp.]